MKELDKILLRKRIKYLPADYNENNIDIAIKIGASRKVRLALSSPFLHEDQLFFIPISKIKDEMISLKIIYEEIEKDILNEDKGAFLIDLSDNYEYIQISEEDKKSSQLPNYLLSLISKIRSLCIENPLGLRVPANYIERDIIFANLCNADFIIFDCSDSLSQKHSNTTISSLPAIVRAHNMKEKLHVENFCIAISSPPVASHDYLKLIALGLDFIYFENIPEQQQYKLYSESDASINKPSSEIISILKKNLYQCGYSCILDIKKCCLVTQSYRLSKLTGIANSFDQDPINIPFYKFKRR